MPTSLKPRPDPEMGPDIRISTMRVLVCGGRYFQDVPLLWRHLDQLHAKSPITCVIEGGSDAVAGEYYGADYWARMWAQARGVNSVTCWADWDQFGRWAGPKRNKEMLERYGPDLVLAFEGGKGTADMVKQAQAAGVAVRSVSKAKDW
jgi:hypothetical protein